MSEAYICDTCGQFGNYLDQMKNHIKDYHSVGRIIFIRYEKTGQELKVSRSDK